MMSKKILEIGSAIGSVLMLILLLIIVNTSGMAASNYGFVASLFMFVLVVSAIGLKLTGVEE